MDEFRIEKGDLIVGMSGSIGKVAVYQSNSPALQNQRVGVFKIVSSGELDFNYLKFFSLTLEKKLLKLGKGVAIKNVSAQEIEDLPIPLPPLPEQRRIAALLDRADRLRRTRRYAAQLSETFLQAVFMRMFGDIVRNPMNWDIETLDDLETRFDYGTSAKCTSEQRGLPVLRIPNILHGDIDLNDLKYAELPDKETSKLLLNKGELIFVRTNGNPDYVGRCAVFNLDAKYLFASYLIRAKLDTSILIPLFLQTHLTSRAGRKAMSPFIRTTAGQSNIGTEGLGQIPVPLPPRALQEKFARIVQQFERLRAQQREAEWQAEHLFQTLLHRAFEGEYTTVTKESKGGNLLKGTGPDG